MRLSISETRVKEIKKGNKLINFISSYEMKIIESEYNKQDLVKFEDFYNFLICEVSMEEDKIHTEILSRVLRQILKTDDETKINNCIEDLTEKALRIHNGY